MSTPDSPALSDLDAVELDILAELRSPEAVATFEMLHSTVRPEAGPLFVELLAIINELSGPNFAVDASLDEPRPGRHRNRAVEQLERGHCFGGTQFSEDCQFQTVDLGQCGGRGFG